MDVGRTRKEICQFAKFRICTDLLDMRLAKEKFITYLGLSWSLYQNGRLSIRLK
ncbi:hypothetical protein IMCC20628_01248 [Hoeflea sp. IMCC20628]|nr:hypothetical protein IMCC20628_01248 [Hoeflea sp. IMCC20628]